MKLDFNSFFNLLKVSVSNIEEYISIKAIIIFIAVFLFFLFIRKRNITKMNVIQIVIEHISTLRHSNSSRLNISEIIAFFIFPLLLSFLFTWKKIIIFTDVNIIITVFAIFAGLLFNLLVLIFDMAKKVRRERENETNFNVHNIKEQLLQETYTNISYCVMLSLILLCLSFIYVIGIYNLYIQVIFSVVIYWLIITFVMTLFMVLKRIYNLLLEEFK